MLAALLNNPPKERRLRQLLRDRLHDRGLVSSSALTMQRRGRPPTVYAVSARGRTLLRQQHERLRGDQRTPDYLGAERNLPAPGRGSNVPHTLATQLVIAALRQFGGTDVKTVWWTPIMPGGRLDVGMAHADHRDKRIRLEDLTGGRTALTVTGDALSAAPGVVEPDATVQMTGHVAGQRRSLTMLLEIDRTDRPAYNTPKLIAYDHFLAGWCLRTRTFRHARPIVVFVARSPQSALRLLSHASDVMTVGLGISGHDRHTYQYYGRTHTAFTCIDWILAGHAYALRMAPTPPDRRDEALHSDAEAVALLPEAWWPKRPTSAR